MDSKLEAIELARRYVGLDPIILDTETTSLARMPKSAISPLWT